GALRYSPAADRNLCRSSLPDREARIRRPGEDHCPSDHWGRAHRRGGAHAVGSETYRDFAETCGADDSGEWVSSFVPLTSFPIVSLGGTPFPPFALLFPALKRWAKLVRPSGACSRYHGLPWATLPCSRSPARFPRPLLILTASKAYIDLGVHLSI